MTTSLVLTQMLNGLQLGVLLFLLAALSGPTTAVVPDEVSIPPLPTFDQLPLEGPIAFGTGASAGTLTWIGSRPVKDQPLVDLGANNREAATEQQAHDEQHDGHFDQCEAALMV